MPKTTIKPLSKNFFLSRLHTLTSGKESIQTFGNEDYSSADDPNYVPPIRQAVSA